MTKLPAKAYISLKVSVKAIRSRSKACNDSTFRNQHCCKQCWWLWLSSQFVTILDKPYSLLRWYTSVC